MQRVQLDQSGVEPRARRRRADGGYGLGEQLPVEGGQRGTGRRGLRLGQGRGAQRPVGEPGRAPYQGAVDDGLQVGDDELLVGGGDGLPSACPATAAADGAESWLASQSDSGSRWCFSAANSAGSASRSAVSAGPGSLGRPWSTESVTVRVSIRPFCRVTDRAGDAAVHGQRAHRRLRPRGWPGQVAAVDAAVCQTSGGVRRSPLVPGSRVQQDRVRRSKRPRSTRSVPGQQESFQAQPRRWAGPELVVRALPVKIQGWSPGVLRRPTWPRAAARRPAAGRSPRT